MLFGVNKTLASSQPSSQLLPQAADGGESNSDKLLQDLQSILGGKGGIEEGKEGKPAIVEGSHLPPVIEGSHLPPIIEGSHSLEGREGGPQIVEGSHQPEDKGGEFLQDAAKLTSLGSAL